MITLEGYKAYAEINSPNSDNKLTSLVAYANDFIEKYCGTKFEPTTVVNEKYTVYGSDVVLKNAPLISVEALTSLGLVDLAHDVEVEESILVLDESLLGEKVLASYTYGYPEMPSAVELAGFELITYFSKREFNKSKSLGGENITYLDPAVIPPHIRAPLDLYRVL